MPSPAARLCFLLLFSWTTAFAEVPRDKPVYLAAGAGGANPLDGVFEKGRIDPLPRRAEDPQAKLLKEFPVGRRSRAVDRGGRVHDVTVSAHDLEPGEYTEMLVLDGAPQGEFLLTSRPVKVDVLSAAPVKLTTQETERLTTEARRIWAEECVRVPAEDMPEGDALLREPRAVAVPQHPELLAISLPVAFQRGGGLDERGAFFFFLDRRTGKTTFARFGHPEWSGNSPDSVTLIRPIMFFRMGSSTTYILTHYQRGWESYGFAILDPLRAQVVARTEF